MEKHLERLKEELDMFSDEHPTITVSRKDLVQLIEQIERLKKENENLK
ncbi:hypothetical protein IHV10_22270 [Fictibacillus sp. 5RED26]|nr:hypothetical protein [Fictibacillus sp. 5RED26]MBH0159099.1 hypothetical protein [Fictibacillus sp. 5RED26]